MRRSVAHVSLAFSLAAVSNGATSCCAWEQADQAPEPTVTQKPAAIDGHASAVDFQGMLSRRTASGALLPERRQKTRVADTSVAGWKHSSKADSLWDFSRAVASVHGC
jgi:hypothetical protein